MGHRRAGGGRADPSPAGRRAAAAGDALRQHQPRRAAAHAGGLRRRRAPRRGAGLHRREAGALRADGLAGCRWRHRRAARRLCRGLDRIAAVREAVGGGADVMVDAHWRFSAGGAAALIRDLAPLDLYWLECPVAEGNLPEIRRLRGRRTSAACGWRGRRR
ncbi:enolase C-terminal domain-like protein [Teichococcus aestuarii]|uniref:enolase C-terminal domain-like protein n=1 Tax=Teichococcus aestuarii TaxID=568898 RepID=UPI0036187550